MKIPTEIVILAVLIAFMLWLNVRATALVLRDSLSEKPQQVAQILLIWMFPIMGAIIVLAVHRPIEKHSGKYRTPPDPGDDLGYPRHGRNRTSHEADED